MIGTRRSHGFGYVYDFGIIRDLPVSGPLMTRRSQ
jgi:hypothetical protein